MTNFEQTLRSIQNILDKRLNRKLYKSIRVEGSHSPGKTHFFFIIFKKDNSGYNMETAYFTNFRMYKPSSDDDVEKNEIRLINELIDGLQKEILSKYLMPKK